MPKKKEKKPLREPKGNRRGGAQPNNQNGVILKDADVRQDAYLDYCHHLSQGKGKKGWFYDKNGFRCSWETMEKYIKDTVEFDPLHKIKAESKGFQDLEQIVIDSAKGKNKEANTATLQMLMRNKYGWDKPEQTTERSESLAIGAVDALCAQLTFVQSSRRIEISNSPSD